MKLFQILLPTHDNGGVPFDPGEFKAVQSELTEKFGGVTAFTSSPGIGLWRDEGRDAVVMDAIALFEVMARTVETEWWKAYRTRLETRFRQDKVIVRIHTFETLD